MPPGRRTPGRVITFSRTARSYDLRQKRGLVNAIPTRPPSQVDMRRPSDGRKMDEELVVWSSKHGGEESMATKPDMQPLIRVKQIAEAGHRRCWRCLERTAGYEVSIGLYVRLICEPCLTETLLDAFPILAEGEEAA
jgi:hypothetical protein